MKRRVVRSTLPPNALDGILSGREKPITLIDIDLPDADDDYDQDVQAWTEFNPD
jgi:hypothetical protein